MSRLLALTVLATVLAVAAPAFAAGPAGGPAAVAGAVPAGAKIPVSEDTVHDVAAQLRCVVCQSLSVADSPSETAHEMKDIIRERLAAGESPEQVRAYFVEKYGNWILLSPPRQGFNLLVWVVPFAGLGLGLVLVLIVVRRWSRRPAAPQAPPLDPAMRARIRREMEREP
ncbi:MAG TPA: cytochrome c-type biogenesis protein [Candidatus Nitrosotalea sp.]|nr:cytochrome c-type biogenesis protein [Candidatus Nitrosotalea sp.]